VLLEPGRAFDAILSRARGQVLNAQLLQDLKSERRSGLVGLGPNLLLGGATGSSSLLPYRFFGLLGLRLA